MRSHSLEWVRNSFGYVYLYAIATLYCSTLNHYGCLNNLRGASKDGKDAIVVD